MQTLTRSDEDSPGIGNAGKRPPLKSCSGLKGQPVGIVALLAAVSSKASVFWKVWRGGWTVLKFRYYNNGTSVGVRFGVVRLPTGYKHISPVSYCVALNHLVEHAFRLRLFSPSVCDNVITTQLTVPM